MNSQCQRDPCARENAHPLQPRRPRLTSDPGPTLSGVPAPIPHPAVLIVGWVLMVCGAVGAVACIAVSRRAPEGSVPAMVVGVVLGVLTVVGFCLLAAVDDRWPRSEV